MKKRELAAHLRRAALIAEDSSNEDVFVGLYGNICLSIAAIYAYYGKKVRLFRIRQRARPQLYRAVARALEHGLKVDLNE